MLWRFLTLKPELGLSRSSKESLSWVVSDFCVFGVYVLCCTDEGCGAPHEMKLQFLLAVIKLVRKLKCSKIAIIKPSIRQDKCLGGGSAVPSPCGGSHGSWGHRIGVQQEGPQRREGTNLRNRHRQGREREAF